MSNNSKFVLDTVLKRLGFLMVIPPLVAFVWLAIGWNIAERPFIYQRNDPTFIASPKPLEDVLQNETKWVRDDNNFAPGWIEWNVPCVEKWRQSNYPKYDFNIQHSINRCRVNLKKDQQVDHLSWDQSFSEFLSEISKFHWSKSALIVFIVGMLLLTGLPEKLYYWLKTGKWPKIDKALAEQPTDKPPIDYKRKIKNVSVVIFIIAYSVLIALLVGHFHLGGIWVVALSFSWLWLVSKASNRTIYLRNHMKQETTVPAENLDNSVVQERLVENIFREEFTLKSTFLKNVMKVILAILLIAIYIVIFAYFQSYKFGVLPLVAVTSFWCWLFTKITGLSIDLTKNINLPWKKSPRVKEPEMNKATEKTTGIHDGE